MPAFRLDFTEKQLARIEGCLDALRQEPGAHWVLLTDVTGQFISERGLPNSMTNLNVEALSALAAGNLATTREIARLIGEEARFKLLLHEGERQSVYLTDLDEELVLVTAFDNSVPIGLVRLGIKQAMDRLQEILREARTTDQLPVANLGEEFGQLLVNEMNFSFKPDQAQNGSDVKPTR